MLNKFTRPFIFLLVLAACIGVFALVLANGYENGYHHVNLVMWDEDLSDSVLGWAIAIPILVVVFLLVLAVMAGVGVLVAGLVVLALGIAAVCALFAVSVAALPVVLVMAVPVLVLVGLVKLMRRT